MFTYTSLPDATKQLRLLSFDASSSETHLSCQLSTYELADCPNYFAISYCYGDASLRAAITINGKGTDINRNGWQALQQARQHNQADSFYWLDSLCINQTDLDEKAIQVHKIGAIFTGASEVLAYFGPESDDSDFFMQVLAKLPQQDHAQPIMTQWRALEDEEQQRVVDWLVSLGSDFERFANALKAFGKRQFFWRVWIYQEMYLAAKVRMICGTEVANMQALSEITLVCSRLHYDPKEAQAPLRKMLEDAGISLRMSDPILGELHTMVTQLHRDNQAPRMLRYGLATFSTVQMALSNLQCADARDNVFATLALFGTSCNILPDYKISQFQLALKILRECPSLESTGGMYLELTKHLCANLRTAPYTEEVKGALARNQAPRLRNFECPTPNDGSMTPRQQTTWACQVLATTSGQMTAPFFFDQATDPDLRLLVDSISKIVYVGQQPVAISTCDLAAGDWIVALREYSRHLRIGDAMFGLVIRRREMDTYDIVGVATFVPGCQPCVSWESCKCQFGRRFHTDFYTSFVIEFDPEELLLLCIRLHAPFGMKRALSYQEQDLPEPPAGLPIRWHASFAMRHDVAAPINVPSELPLRPEPMDRELAFKRLSLVQSPNYDTISTKAVDAHIVRKGLRGYCA